MVIAGVEVAAGTKVVLRPGHRRADAHDIFLAGMTATVAGVFSDAEGQQHIAVTVDDDPATEELAWQGRYLFFHPDEVEVTTERGPMRALVAGIGNIFFADDGFGVEVARRLAEREVPRGRAGRRLRHPRRAPGLRAARRLRPARARRRDAARRAAGDGGRDRGRCGRRADAEPVASTPTR